MVTRRGHRRHDRQGWPPRRGFTPPEFARHYRNARAHGNVCPSTPGQLQQPSEPPTPHADRPPERPRSHLTTVGPRLHVEF
ncbi:hypothetical protein HBB16_09875 [Pseudonocardia sp. MCCB 268]|nr:hypothetical protein [Pseudonocardia cytotoxica]